jgi:hypothetical protein
LAIELREGSSIPGTAAAFFSVPLLFSLCILCAIAPEHRAAGPATARRGERGEKKEERGERGEEKGKERGRKREEEGEEEEERGQRRGK